MVRDDLLGLVVGVEHYNVLGLIRSLGEVGIRTVYVQVGTASSYIKHSKYVVQYYNCNYDNLTKLLFGIIEEHFGKKVCVFPTDDKTVKLIDESRELLGKAIIPSMNGKADDLLDKSIMSRLASKYDIYVPEEAVIDLSNNNGLPVWNIYPAIIKPLKSYDGKKSDIAIIDKP